MGLNPLSIKGVTFPSPLKEGDKIALLAPAGRVDYHKVKVAAEVLKAVGYEPVIYPTTHGQLGQFSAIPEKRFADLKKALTDPEIRAVICARGGYGIVHILDSVAALPLEDDPKWVVGFSDISALHGLMASKGIASIHGSMVHGLVKGVDNPENQLLFEILRGEYPVYEFPANSRNHHGEVQGKFLGGNLSVIQALIDTPYDIIKPGTILFIEDVSEPVYKINRIICQLKMSGKIENLAGLVIGHFTDYKADYPYTTMEAMLEKELAEYPDLPIAYNIPIGHISNNIPVIESADVLLNISPEGVTLSFRPYPENQPDTQE